MKGSHGWLGGFKSGPSGPLLFCLNMTLCQCVHDSLVPNEHAHRGSMGKDGAHVVANLPILGVDVHGGADRRPCRLECVAVE